MLLNRRSDISTHARTPDHDVEYFVAWALSAAMALATVLIVWHFNI